MVWELVIEHLAHVRDVAFFKHKFSMHTINMAIFLPYKRAHWLYVEIPSPYERSARVYWRLFNYMDLPIRRMISPGTADAGQPFASKSNASAKASLWI